MIEYEKESKNFDAVIIGSRQAGNPLAKDLALSGWKVAVVERGNVGGSCINYGCTPSKTMGASALTVDLVRRSSHL
ncbi:MAG: FAD-dependent oxidoreductase [Ignavibacteriaceae bacterium]